MNGIKQIFSQKMAGYLMVSGFCLLRLDVNLKDPKKHIFVFKETPELLKCMNKYTEAKNSGR